jgi:hypothetical protein
LFGGSGAAAARFFSAASPSAVASPPGGMACSSGSPAHGVPAPPSLSRARGHGRAGRRSGSPHWQVLGLAAGRSLRRGAPAGQGDNCQTRQPGPGRRRLRLNKPPQWGGQVPRHSAAAACH